MAAGAACPAPAPLPLPAPAPVPGWMAPRRPQGLRSGARTDTASISGDASRWPRPFGLPLAGRIVARLPADVHNPGRPGPVGRAGRPAPATGRGGGKEGVDGRDEGHQRHLARGSRGPGPALPEPRPARCDALAHGLERLGKSTIAFTLEHLLIEHGWTAYVLDGDNIRQWAQQEPRLQRRGSAEEHPPDRRGRGALRGRRRHHPDEFHLALPGRPRPGPGPAPGGGPAVSRDLREHPDRGLRAARPEEASTAGRGRGDQVLHRHRRPLRAAARPGDRAAPGPDVGARVRARHRGGAAAAGDPARGPRLAAVALQPAGYGRGLPPGAARVKAGPSALRISSSVRCRAYAAPLGVIWSHWQVTCRTPGCFAERSQRRGSCRRAASVGRAPTTTRRAAVADANPDLHTGGGAAAAADPDANPHVGEDTHAPVPRLMPTAAS